MLRPSFFTLIGNKASDAHWSAGTLALMLGLGAAWVVCVC